MENDWYRIVAPLWVELHPTRTTAFGDPWTLELMTSHRSCSRATEGADCIIMTRPHNTREHRHKCLHPHKPVIWPEPGVYTPTVTLGIINAAAECPCNRAAAAGGRTFIRCTCVYIMRSAADGSAGQQMNISSHIRRSETFMAPHWRVSCSAATFSEALFFDLYVHQGFSGLRVDISWLVSWLFCHKHVFYLKHINTGPKNP